MIRLVRYGSSILDSSAWSRSVVLLYALLAVSACGGQKHVLPHAPQTTSSVVRLVGALDQNPDPRGRPSPVVVHVLALTQTAEFEAATFDALTDDRDAILGGTRTAASRVTLRPGERTTVQLAGPAGARHIGIVVEYADLLGAHWRTSAPLVKRDRASEATDAPDAVVFVERAKVRIETAVTGSDSGGGLLGRDRGAADVR